MKATLYGHNAGFAEGGAQSNAHRPPPWDRHFIPSSADGDRFMEFDLVFAGGRVIDPSQALDCVATSRSRAAKSRLSTCTPPQHIRT
jgi:hypothetical protein